MICLEKKSGVKKDYKMLEERSQLLQDEYGSIYGATMNAAGTANPIAVGPDASRFQ